MAEPYITRIRRENEVLKEYVRKNREWKAALEHAHTTGRKYDAFRHVQNIATDMEKLEKIIEPFLAEQEKT